MGNDRIHVEVAYALPHEQVILPLKLPAGSTLMQAIEQSGILERFPDIDLSRQKVGIFGKLKKPDQVLRDGDRVEIYRPLIADPKEVRKQRAAQGKRMKKGGGDLEPAQ
ncbi:MAG TPA: RnfH family protein [Gammaproteobacteria bacterium]|nr:RnfH family protein [Gammaproteobacteria bacterium]